MYAAASLGPRSAATSRSRSYSQTYTDSGHASFLQITDWFTNWRARWVHPCTMRPSASSFTPLFYPQACVNHNLRPPPLPLIIGVGGRE